MPLPSETMINLLRTQLEAHGTVVWYDPQRSYQSITESLEPASVADAVVHCYDPERGFIWLRRHLEPLWEKAPIAPRLILYVPLSRAETQNALIEFEVAGVVMRPGQQPQECNTSLAAVARRALETIFPAATLEDIIHQVESGRLSLEELDQLADKGIEAQTGALALIFGTGNVSDIAIRFLTDSSLDAQIEHKQAMDALATLLSQALGVSFDKDPEVAALRARVARQVLATEFIQSLEDALPEQLRTFPLAPGTVARQEAVAIAQAWRNRRDTAACYLTWADRVQVELGMASLKLELDSLVRTQTFSSAEVHLQTEVERTLTKTPSTAMVKLAEQRREGFWATQDPHIKTRWEVIVNAGQVIGEAARVAKALKGRAWSACALFSQYACGDHAWCALDTAQRHLERDFSLFDADPQHHKSLLELVAHARQRYATVANDLAERFTRAYATDGFELNGVLPQVDVYHQVVEPAVKEGSTAYLLVDAFRFEMARELCTILGQDWELELTPASATPPTITVIGMAALLLGAEKGLSIVPGVGGKLAAVVTGRTLKTREERVSYLGTVLDSDAPVVHLDQLVPLSDPHLRNRLESAPLILVTASDEIDGLCETAPALARRMLDDVFNQLRRGVKQLFGLGFQAIIISADHGYLFGERMTSGEAIDPPGGKTVLLKRRVWVGHGGASSNSYLRQPLSAFGLGGDLEMATPWSLSCFKVPGGAMQYFHGGLSLPELVIPVVTVRPGAGQPATAGARIEWVLTLGSKTISTRFLSVTVQGRTTELLPIELPAVRVEVRSGGQAISVPVSASYGFQEATKDVKLELKMAEPQTIAENTVTLMIAETPSVTEVTVHLLDATTGVSLARLEHIPFSITL